MHPSTVELGRREGERLETLQTYCPELRKGFQQLVEGLTSGVPKLGEPIERREGPPITVRKNQLEPRNPIGTFAVNQMAYDIERTPTLRPFVLKSPRFG
jgi:hypothetical protein